MWNDSDAFVSGALTSATERLPSVSSFVTVMCALFGAPTVACVPGFRKIVNS